MQTPVGEYEVCSIALTDIGCSPNRARWGDRAIIDRLAESMKKVGLLQPIIVQPDKTPGATGFMLIAGLHRALAAKQLKWETINCHVYTGLDALTAEEMELRENLDRGELSAAEVAVHTARLVKIHVEKVKLKRGNPHGEGEANSPQVGGHEKKGATAKAVAKETGRSATSVERSATRAKRVPRLTEVIGTSLDKGTEIDALAGLPVNEQSEIIDRAVAGESVTARVKNSPVVEGAVRKTTSAEDVLAEVALGIKYKKLSERQSSAGAAEKAAALSEKYAPSTENDDPLRRQTPEARLTRMFDEASVKLNNFVFTLEEVVDYRHANKLDDARIPVRFAEELARLDKALARLRQREHQDT